MEKGGERGEMSPGDGDQRKRDGFWAKRRRVVAVMDEREAEADGEEIEKGVVAGQADEKHEGEETEGGGEADFGLGKEKGEGE